MQELSNKRHMDQQRVVIGMKRKHDDLGERFQHELTLLRQEVGKKADKEDVVQCLADLQKLLEEAKEGSQENAAKFLLPLSEKLDSVVKVTKAQETKVHGLKRKLERVKLRCSLCSSKRGNVMRKETRESEERDEFEPEEEGEEELVCCHLKDFLKYRVADLNEQLEQKVDHAVLKELMPHLVTKVEFKKYLLKQLHGMFYAKEELDEKLLQVQDVCTQRIRAASQERRGEGVETRKSTDWWEQAVEEKVHAAQRSWWKRLDSWLAESEVFHSTVARKQQEWWSNLYPQVTNDLQKLVSDQILSGHLAQSHSGFRDELEAPIPLDYQRNTLRQLGQEVDDKLLLLATELSNMKASLHSTTSPSSPSFYSYAQYLWKSGQLKFGSSVPWSVETVNTDDRNFVWQKDATHVKVEMAGLYEITFAFFTKMKPSVQLVVNGEPGNVF
jgi:hypothetical protein